MNTKLNTICFIFLFLFLIGAVSAAASENETVMNMPQPDPDQDLCKLSVENDDEKLETSNVETEKLGVSSKATSPKEKVTLNAPDLKMHYKDGSKFKATLKDKNKKAIKNAQIDFTVNGKTYSKKTDSKGIAMLDINLKSGNYIILTKFAGTSKYDAISKKSNITVKSTIKASDLTKYYKNTASYFSTFYNQKGKLLKNATVKFKINNKEYSIKTNDKGVGKLAINLKPGKYSICLTNPLTLESVSRTVTVKSLIVTKDLTINGSSTGKFNVQILNSYGKASPNKKVTLTVNGKTYTKTTNKTGIATLDINLDAGTYKITIEYDGLKNTNKIQIIKKVKSSVFTHTTLIPNYVNVTANYVYPNSAYSLKTGINGIVKMPKNEVFTIQIGSKTYTFSTARISGINSTLLGYKSYLIPFDGSPIQCDANKANLKKDGIIITRVTDYTQIDYQSRTKDNVALFGFYASKGLDKSETLTYMEAEKITAKVNFQTQSYDETGLRYSLAKFYGKSIYDFNYKSYDEITNHNTASIKFTNNGEPVTFGYFGNSIAGYPTKEDIITRFKINGKEELEKIETISYGLSKSYRNSLGFEALQAYTIINERITQKILEGWVSRNPDYLSRFGVMNVYGMHLASLETAWLADELADKYSKEFNVKWSRANTLTILGGINLDDTYLNILNADMGMLVKGNAEANKMLFRLANSINLPNIEDYALSEVSRRYWNNTTDSFDSIFSAITNGKFSIAELGGMIYLFAEDGSKSAIIINKTDGVANVIMSHGNATYKGSSISTSKDCCSVGILPQDIIAGIKNSIKIFAPGIYVLSDKLEKIHPFSILAYQSIKFGLGYVLKGTAASAAQLFTIMTVVQTIGTTYKDKMADEKDWHTLMDTATFTRPGYLQGKKIYNIPNKKGGYDYIEVKINKDLTLDRTSAIYISNGKTKTLTKAETYKYFSDDYWTPFNMPSKYWDESWRG